MRLPLWALLRLARLDTSLLGALAVFVPLFTRSRDFLWSAGQAIPLLAICICTFISNDLEDLERDQINHPDRPLPARQLRPELAAVLYFMFLGLALFWTRRFVEPGMANWYYGLLVLSISYGHIVDWLPSVKAIYVASLTTMPLLVVSLTFPEEQGLFAVAGGLFLFCLGRELCMDINDRRGDNASALHDIAAAPVAVGAFCLQSTALVLLAIQIDSPRDLSVLGVMGVLTLAALIYWFHQGRRKVAVATMKLQMALGLNFLV